MLQFSSKRAAATSSGSEPPFKKSKAEETALKKQSKLLFDLMKLLDDNLSKKQLMAILELNNVKIPSGVSAMQEW